MELSIKKTVESLRKTLEDKDLPIEVQNSIKSKIKALESKKDILK